MRSLAVSHPPTKSLRESASRRGRDFGAPYLGRGPGVGGGGGVLNNFNTGRLRPKVQPITLSYTISAEKVPLLYTFY